MPYSKTIFKWLVNQLLLTLIQSRRLESNHMPNMFHNIETMLRMYMPQQYEKILIFLHSLIFWRCLSSLFSSYFKLQASITAEFS